MRDAVWEAFVPFTERFEGSVPFFYCDIKGLVTIAIGNLVDPREAAIGLPMMRPDGTAATWEEIAMAWDDVKARQDLKMRGGMAYRDVTTLRLTDEGISTVVHRKLSQVDEHLSNRFAQWAQWPADAQLGTLSMAWACGPAFHFPHWELAALAGDWFLAASESRIDEHGNPGVKPRNRANMILFENAAHVLKDGKDPDVLYYPTALVAPTDPAPAC